MNSSLAGQGTSCTFGLSELHRNVHTGQPLVRVLSQLSPVKISPSYKTSATHNSLFQLSRHFSSLVLQVVTLSSTFVSSYA